MNSETARTAPPRCRAVLALGVVASLLTLPARAQLQGGQAFSAQLTATGLEITGATPGGEVAVFGAWRQRHVYWSEGGRVEERVVDTDGDGALSWDLGREVPPATALVAVDLTTGDWSAAAPAGFGLRPLPREEWQVSEDGSSLSIRSRRLEIFWARPGVGTWSRTAMDGGALDHSPTQAGTLVVSMPELAASAGEGAAGEEASSAPQQLSAGDVLVAVDLQSLEYFVYDRVGGGA